MARFIEGPAGAGKTSLAITQVMDWLRAGVPANQILILVPQRTLGIPYFKALNDSEVSNAASVQIATLGGLARQALSQYWGRVASHIVPNWDGREPVFLTIETAQYYMAQFVEPSLQAGYFDGVSVERSRIVAQTLDNLSKAAINAFPLDEVVERLTAAWVGHSTRPRVYRAAIDIAEKFQAYCRENLLLDFSLQVEFYMNILLKDEIYAGNLRETYRYLIADNLEEDFPVMLDFVDWLWPSLDDACLVYDTDAGYRIFLGASPELAYQFKQRCDQVDMLDKLVSHNPATTELGTALENAFGETPQVPELPHLEESFEIAFSSFYPEMIDRAVNKVVELVGQGVSPHEIVILAPFLGDSLRFTIFDRLQAAGIPFVSHRPSRAIRDEPVARAMLALIALAYPGTPVKPNKTDVARAFVQLIDGLDPIRAELLVQIAYRPNQDELGSFDAITQTMQQRITYRVGERYEKLRQRLIEFRQNASEIPPDYFMQSMFDFAAQPGYRFHVNLEAGRIVSELIESARNFRAVVNPDNPETDVNNWADVAHRYAQLVGDGVLAALHFASWQDEYFKDAVFVAPAYTFLMRNRFVDYQFWLDIGSGAWAERLDQPLTHPYVLHRAYPKATMWTDEMEAAAQQERLRKLILGLVRRCRKHVYLGFADLGEQGFEQRGPLLKIFNHILQAYGNAADSIS